ncbi:hypothetical protein [Botryobacter ruber]|uniref:hypothetical protein n=1 Tax=Botryobacter ruber TaxID=2171629 RepID=UPI000E0C7B8F|nr:hypothetical protein [Botryobacter ruber]
MKKADTTVSSKKIFRKQKPQARLQPEIFGKSTLIPVALSCLVLFLQGCYYNVEEELYPSNACTTAAVTFSSTIRPILARNCTSCHSGPSPEAGLDLSAYAGAAAVANNGKLLGVITHASGFPPMPQDASKLPECQISQIRAWVEAGAPNN